MDLAVEDVSGPHAECARGEFRAAQARDPFQGGPAVGYVPHWQGPRRTVHGPEAIQLLADAGVCALEGRRAETVGRYEAVGRYQDAIAKLRASGGRLTIAQAQRDALITLPDERLPELRLLAVRLRESGVTGTLTEPT